MHKRKCCSLHCIRLIRYYVICIAFSIKCCSLHCIGLIRYYVICIAFSISNWANNAWFVVSLILRCLLDRSVQHQPIGVPQTAGFSFQPLQPNILTTPFLTLSSAYQRGHCLWMIVWTLNNSARSWILIMHQTVFLFVQLCLVLKIVSHYRKYICN